MANHTSYIVAFIVALSLSSCHGGILEKIEGGCQANGIYCKSKNSYTFCTNLGDASLILVTEYFCPEDYFCLEEGAFPCVAELPTTTPPETTTSEVITTTIITTTTPKPQVAPPSCTSHGYHPAYQCTQYYECVAVMWWYEARIRDCSTGLHYSETQKKCVEPATSGCIVP